MDLLTLLIVILVVAWVGGLTFAPAVGSLLHLLLVVAVILFIVRLMQGQRI